MAKPSAQYVVLLLLQIMSIRNLWSASIRCFGSRYWLSGT